MAKKHSEIMHDVFIVGLWVAGIFLALKIVPALISDVSAAAAPILASAQNATGTVSSSGTNGASSSTSLPPAYSSQPNSGGTSTLTMPATSTTSSSGVSTAAASTGSAVTTNLLPGLNFIGKWPNLWGGQPPRAILTAGFPAS